MYSVFWSTGRLIPSAAALPVTTAPVVSPAPSTSTSVVVRRGRWSALDEAGRTIDVFGPVRLGGAEVWYAENDSGCVSVLHQDGAVWHESVLSGDCTPWPDLQISASDTELTLKSDETRLVLDFSDPAPGTVKNGRWTGTLLFAHSEEEGPEWLRLLAGTAESLEAYPVHLDVEGRTGTIEWEQSGCRTTLTAPRTGAGWEQFTERASDTVCIDGAKVTVQMLSGDAVLVQWNGGGMSAEGVLRPEE